MNMEYQREVLSFEEKTALAELEESKATERVKEIRYQKARFQLDYFMASLKAQQEEKAKKVAEQKPAQPEVKQ